MSLLGKIKGNWQENYQQIYRVGKFVEPPLFINNHIEVHVVINVAGVKHLSVTLEEIDCPIKLVPMRFSEFLCRRWKNGLLHNILSHWSFLVNKEWKSWLMVCNINRRSTKRNCVQTCSIIIPRKFKSLLNLFPKLNLYWVHLVSTHSITLERCGTWKAKWWW